MTLKRPDLDSKASVPCSATALTALTALPVPRLTPKKKEKEISKHCGLPRAVSSRDVVASLYRRITATTTTAIATITTTTTATTSCGLCGRAFRQAVKQFRVSA